MAKREMLLSEINNLIEFFEGHSKRHKRQYRHLRYLVFALASISTVLAGAALAYPVAQRHLNVAIVLVTALVGLVTSLEGLRRPAELWIHERTTLYALKDLKRAIEYTASGTISDDSLDGHFSTMQAILGASADEWAQKVRPKPIQNEPHGGTSETTNP